MPANRSARATALFQLGDTLTDARERPYHPLPERQDERMKVTVKIDAKNLEGTIADLRKRLDDCTDGMKLVGDIIVDHAQEAFPNPAERPKAWSPLAESTIAARKRKGVKDTSPLVEKGTLSRSPRVVEVTGNSVTVGSDRAAGGHSLAAIHQFGTKNGRIPARPFFPIEGNGFTAKVAKEITDTFGKWLLGAK